jgi:transposase-like protein
MEGASETAAVCQALIDNLVGRGLDPAVCRLFIIDGSRALLKAIRKSFGRNTPIQRCQVHYADVRIMPTCGAEPAWTAAIAA